MDFQQCTEALRGKVGESSGLDAVLKFDCGADGVVVIDGKSVPNSVSNTDREADCTVSIDLCLPAFHSIWNITAPPGFDLASQRHRRTCRRKITAKP